MLNPSSASELVNDPTISRCQDFARRLNGGQNTAFEVCNLFVRITPDRKALKSSARPVLRRDNDLFLVDACRGADRLICAWGGSGTDKTARRRARQVFALLRTAFPGVLECHGTNRNGSPTHPLYLPADATPEPKCFDRHWQ